MSDVRKKKINILKLAQLSILIAVMLLMAYTPIGYLKIGVVEITFMMIPVIIGAIVLGPAAGALLGFVFGLTSFLQCFGVSAFGTMLCSINPFYTAVMCFIPRILMGFATGYIYIALRKWRVPALIVASVAAPLINTTFFVGSLLLLFGNTDYILGLRGGMSIWAFIVALVTLNGLIEAAASAVVGSSVSAAVLHYTNRRKPADTDDN